MPAADQPVPTYLDLIRWIEVESPADNVIGGGLLRVTGAADDGTPQVTAPNQNGQDGLLVAHPTGITAGGRGLAAPGDYVPAAYDTADGTPAVGETWGARAGEWRLRKGFSGWRVGSSPTLSQDLNLVEVWRRPKATPFCTSYLVDVCPVDDGVGGILGIAKVVALSDGSARCVVSNFCNTDDCSGSSVPPPLPPSPPPPPPEVPPSPLPSTYDVFVQIVECEGVTTGFPYTVDIDDSSEGSQSVSSSGAWFTSIPWGTNTAAVLTYAGSELVWWAVGTVECGGSTSFGSGLTATINGSSCDNVAVTFTIGGCSPELPPSDISDIAVAKSPPIPPPPP